MGKKRVRKFVKSQLEFQQKRMPVALRPVRGYQSHCPLEGPQYVEKLKETVDRREQIYSVPAIPID